MITVKMMRSTTAAPAPRIMPQVRLRRGRLRQASAITTALSPDRMMLMPIILAMATAVSACEPNNEPNHSAHWSVTGASTTLPPSEANRSIAIPFSTADDLHGQTCRWPVKDNATSTGEPSGRRRRGRRAGRRSSSDDLTELPGARPAATGCRVAGPPPLDTDAGAGIWYAKPQPRRSHLVSMNDVSKTSGGGRHGTGRAIHPGSGRRKARPFPRAACCARRRSAAVRALLGERPRERALLIEYLHLIQDQEGCLPEGHLHALAEELRIPMAEVYEVATFYAHFDMVGDGEAAPAEGHDPRVRQPELHAGRRGESCLPRCKARSCAEMSVRVVRAPCIGSCDTAPAAEVGHRHVDHATPAKLRTLALRGEVHPRCRPTRISTPTRKAGGYAVLQVLPVGRAQGGGRDRRRSRTAACAGSAAPASRPGASGAWCAPRRGRG